MSTPVPHHAQPGNSSSQPGRNISEEENSLTQERALRRNPNPTKDGRLMQTFPSHLPPRHKAQTEKTATPQQPVHPTSDIPGPTGAGPAGAGSPGSAGGATPKPTARSPLPSPGGGAGSARLRSSPRLSAEPPPAALWGRAAGEELSGRCPSTAGRVCPAAGCLLPFPPLPSSWF